MNTQQSKIFSELAASEPKKVLGSAKVPSAFSERQWSGKMKTGVAYKNCLIYIESFQLTHASGWIPRYTLMRQDSESEWSGAPSCRDRLDKVFWSKDEADEFALEDAMQWIDKS